MSYFNIVAQTTENTVVTEYEPVKTRSDSYQSEVALEKEFIRLLCEQGYEYLPIHSEAELIANLRKKLEELNGYTFTDSEWEWFFSECIANANDGIEDKTRRIQEDFVQVLRRDTGESKNITLIDKIKIIIPLAKPGIASVSIFNFLTAWEEFPWANTVINDNLKRTIPIAISGFFGQHQFTQWGYVFALSVFSLLPILTVFIFCQRFFVAGLVNGSVKG